MASINPTGGGSIANLPSSSSTKPSDQDLANDGVIWGDNVAETEYSTTSFNFDQYAQSTAAQMSAQGYSPSQVSEFINSMYAGYIMDGGLATSQATGILGSGVSTAGMLGNAGTWGSLNLPGQNNQGDIQLIGQSTVAMDAAQGFNLGEQIGSESSPINFPQYRANLEADLQRAGYSQSQVGAFMSGFDSGYNATHTNGVTNPTSIATQYAASAAAGMDVEGYINNTVLPWIKSVPGFSSPAAVNAYVDQFRAAFLAGGDSTNTSLMNSAYEAGANQVAANTSGFNLENYINNTLPTTVPNWNSLSSQQKEIYINAFSAGYLQAGGTNSVAASTIVSPSIAGASTSQVTQPAQSVPAGGGTSGSVNTALSQNAATVDQWAITHPGAAPQASVSLFSEYLSSSNPTLAGDANQLQGDLNTLSSTNAALAYAESAYNLADHSQNGVAPDSSGSLQNAGYWAGVVADLKGQQQGAWESVRKDEAKFFGDLAAVSSDPNASTAAAVYKNYVNDAHYTMEGEMPSSWTEAGISTAASTAVSTAPAAVSSAAFNFFAANSINTTNLLPSDVTNVLQDPYGSADVTQQDFTQIVQGYEKLLQTNPQAYWASLGAIKDANLAGAIQYSVQEMTVNHSEDMVSNGASPSSESGILGGYWQQMHAKPSTFYNYAPNQGDTQYNGTISQISHDLKWNDTDSIVNFCNNPSSSSGSPHDFSDTCQLAAYLYKNNRPQYYAMLSQIKDPKTRDAVNSAVQLEFTQHPDHYDATLTGKGSNADDKDWQNYFTQIMGNTGFTASSNAKDQNASFNTGAIVNGV